MEPDEPKGRFQQRAVGMYTSRGGRWSLTSLGLRGLLLDRPMHTAYTARTYTTKRAIDESAQPYVHVFHVVVEGARRAWAFACYS